MDITKLTKKYNNCYTVELPKKLPMVFNEKPDPRQYISKSKSGKFIVDYPGHHKLFFQEESLAVFKTLCLMENKYKF